MTIINNEKSGENEEGGGVFKKQEKRSLQTLVVYIDCRSRHAVWSGG